MDFALPAEGAYATGIAFLPQGDADAHEAAAAVEKIVVEEGLKVLGWREVGTDDSSLGALARDAMPTFRQIFIGSEGDKYTGMDLERRAYVVRKRTEHELGSEGAGKGGPGSETVYFPSLSGQTFVYKGMLTTPAAQGFLPRPAGRSCRERTGPGPLALLHQHVPVVAAGAPVPPGRSQR